MRIEILFLKIVTFSQPLIRKVMHYQSSVTPYKISVSNMSLRWKHHVHMLLVVLLQRECKTTIVPSIQTSSL